MAGTQTPKARDPRKTWKEPLSSGDSWVEEYQHGPITIGDKTYDLRTPPKDEREQAALDKFIKFKWKQFDRRQELDRFLGYAEPEGEIHKPELGPVQKGKPKLWTGLPRAKLYASPMGLEEIEWQEEQEYYRKNQQYVEVLLSMKTTQAGTPGYRERKRANRLHEFELGQVLADQARKGIRHDTTAGELGE